MTALQVSLGAINFNDDTPDSNGALWYLTEWEGWDSPQQRLTSMDLPGISGVVTLDNVYGPRSIILRGVCKATSATAHYQAKYRLADVTNALITEVALSATEDIVRTCMVRRSAPLRMQEIGKGSFTFEINLQADDPRKYAAVSSLVTSVGNNTVNNAGNVETFPTFTTSASVTADRALTMNGNVLTLLPTIPTALILNAEKYTATIGAVSYIDLVQRGSVWPIVEKGDNTFNTPIGGTITWKSAWI